MDNRAYEANASVTPPTPPASPSSGYPKPGNPATNDPATKPGPYWVYAIGEEVRNVIIGAGLTPNLNDLTQLRAAILSMIQSANSAVIIGGATFEASVTDGEAVRWDSTNSRFDEAIADGTTNNQAVGIADVTNSRVYCYGETPPLFSGLTPGSRYYLSDATAGAVTATKPADGVFIGIAKSATTMFVDVDPDTTTALPIHGQCRLSYVSTTQIKLSRFNGRRIVINGISQEIPSAGVTLANTGLTASNLYYVYAYMNAGTMTLEAVATGHSVDAATGIEIKTGDATRTLVGAVYMDAGSPGTFADTAAKRYTRSWSNDPGIRGRGTFSVNRSTSSLTYAKPNAEIDIGAVLWAGERVLASANGSIFNTDASSAAIAIGRDGTSELPGHETIAVTTNASEDSGFSLAGESDDHSEGFHNFTLLAAKSLTANTITFYSSTIIGSQQAKTYLHISTKGVR